MKKMEKGYHIYININNFDDILRKEESATRTTRAKPWKRDGDF